jgi:hypothetical protein
MCNNEYLCCYFLILPWLVLFDICRIFNFINKLYILFNGYYSLKQSYRPSNHIIILEKRKYDGNKNKR